uniref:Uncharacterized protein n=1 Tax=viral metagenome TaxID=1070528 RepID=A0A6H1ZCI4_9ZZZZ
MKIKITRRFEISTIEYVKAQDDDLKMGCEIACAYENSTSKVLNILRENDYIADAVCINSHNKAEIVLNVKQFENEGVKE